MKSILFVLLICLSTMAKSFYTWSGFKDTLIIHTTLDSATVRYSSAILTDLGNYESFFYVVSANDTDQAGFSADSLNFEYGIQVGTFVSDSNSTTNFNNQDTAWYQSLFVLDTFTVDSFGAALGAGYYDNEGDLVVTTRGGIDTTSVAGYATKCGFFGSLKGHLLRFWAQGLNGKQKTADSTRISISIQGPKK